MRKAVVGRGRSKKRPRKSRNVVQEILRVLASELKKAGVRFVLNQDGEC